MNFINRLKYLFFDISKTKKEYTSNKTQLSNYRSPFWDKSQLDPYNPDTLVQRKCLSVYEDMVDLDDQVSAVTQMRINAVLSTGWEILPSKEDGVNEKDQEEMAKFGKYVLTTGLAGSFEDDLEEICLAWYYGFSVTEKNMKIYKEGEWKGKSGYSSFKTRAPHSILFYLDDKGNLTKLVQQTADGEIVLPPNKFIVYTHKPHWGNMYGTSDLRPAYRPYYLKDMALRGWGMYLDRHSVPPVIVKVPPGMSKSDRDDLEQAFERLQPKTVLSYPDGVDVELLEPSGKSGGQEFEKAIDRYDLMIARALLLPDLLGYGKTTGGSYNLGEKQVDIFKLTLNSLRSRVEEQIVMEQILKPLFKMNFGEKVAYPIFKFKPYAEEDYIALITTWITAAEKGTVIPTKEDEAKIREKLGMPPRTESSTLLADEHMEQNNERIGGEDIDESNNTENSNKDTSKEDRNNKNISEDVKQDGEEDKASKKENFKMYGKTSHEKKVDFKKIAKEFDENTLNTTIRLSEVVTKMADDLIRSILRKNIVETNDFKEIEKLGLHYLPEYRSILKQDLHKVFSDGRSEGLSEASGKKFAISTEGNLPPKKALAYLEAKAFSLTGTEKEHILKNVKASLYSGMKSGKSTNDIIFDIEKFFADYKATHALPLGEIKNIDKIIGRLGTIVRTNLSDAYNQGRLEGFQDPSVKSNIMAYQYSAIMDSVTSDFCAKHNGKIFKVGDPFIAQINPPNHFNCRSLLVPVLSDEKYEIDKKPALTEQEAKSWGKFGGKV